GERSWAFQADSTWIWAATSAGVIAGQSDPAFVTQGSSAGSGTAPGVRGPVRRAVPGSPALVEAAPPTTVMPTTRLSRLAPATPAATAGRVIAASSVPVAAGRGRAGARWWRPGARRP